MKRRCGAWRDEMRPDDLPARLASKIEQVTESGCWIWLGQVSPTGYGRTWKKLWGESLAHRAVYRMLSGPITPGLCLDHKCRVRSCVNPDHLRQVTIGQNTMAPGSQSLQAKNARKTHCPKGHPYSESNVYITPSRFSRLCVECRRISMRGRAWRTSADVPVGSKYSPVCVNGHPFNEENTVHYTRDGYKGRGCRACRREWSRQSRQRRSAHVAST